MSHCSAFVLLAASFSFERLDALGYAVRGQVVFDAGVQHGDFFFIFFGELARGRELGLGVVITFEAVQIIGQFEVVIEVFGLEFDGLSERQDGFFPIAEAGENFG